MATCCGPTKTPPRLQLGPFSGGILFYEAGRYCSSVHGDAPLTLQARRRLQRSRSGAPAGTQRIHPGVETGEGRAVGMHVAGMAHPAAVFQMIRVRSVPDAKRLSQFPACRFLRRRADEGCMADLIGTCLGRAPHSRRRPQPARLRQRPYHNACSRPPSTRVSNASSGYLPFSMQAPLATSNFQPWLGQVRVHPSKASAGISVRWWGQRESYTR